VRSTIPRLSGNAAIWDSQPCDRWVGNPRYISCHHHQTRATEPMDFRCLIRKWMICPRRATLLTSLIARVTQSDHRMLLDVSAMLRQLSRLSLKKGKHCLLLSTDVRQVMIG
jgi:hypothetical protein